MMNRLVLPLLLLLTFVGGFVQEADAQSVEPLLSSSWGQRDPYNRLCPDYYTNNGNHYKCRAGCVAVSMAQVMYYYRYPTETKEKIEGYLNFVFWWDGSKIRYITLKDIPARTPLDWALMHDAYRGSEPEEDGDAVAQLMLCCGESVGMKYDRSSSASPYKIADAMKSKFGYAQSTRYVARKNYSLTEWELLLRDELMAGRPIIYGGEKKDGGGHSFILDGYRADDGLFHVNWGSDGVSNGWFSLDNLSPYDNDDGYNKNQDAIIGIAPPAGYVSSVKLADASMELDEWYTLSGVRITKPLQPGIYLHNGCKVIVR